MTIDHNACRSCSLHTDIDKLQDRIHTLEHLLGEDIQFPLEWHLTALETAMFSILYRRELVSIDAAMAAVYSDRVNPPEDKIVQIYIHKLRRRLAPFDIKINTVWGRGYYIPPESKQRAKQQIDIARETTTHHEPSAPNTG